MSSLATRRRSANPLEWLVTRLGLPKAMRYLCQAAALLIGLIGAPDTHAQGLGGCLTNNDCPSNPDACTIIQCDTVARLCFATPRSCNDANACTTDACDPAVGCISQPVQCDDGNACTAESCDPATGCQASPVNCSDNNACTVDSCNPDTGCASAPLNCDDANACTADSCDPARGCVSESVSCDDNNACTTDACDPLLGCTAALVSCNDGNACTVDSCSPGTGCESTPLNCDDNDACTVDACDPAIGCSSTPVTCDDGNACTADSCDPAAGGCQFTPVVGPGCDSVEMVGGGRIAVGAGETARFSLAVQFDGGVTTGHFTYNRGRMHISGMVTLVHYLNPATQSLKFTGVSHDGACQFDVFATDRAEPGINADTLGVTLSCASPPIQAVEAPLVSGNLQWSSPVIR